jgi:uncharacterized membrane protein YfcA
VTDPQVAATVALAALAAGMIQGLAGFGSALVAVPVLALVLPPATLVPLMVLLGVFISLFNLLSLRHAWDLTPALPLLGGYVLGTPLGLLFLTQAPQNLILGSLGLLISLYAGLSLAGRQPDAPWLRHHRVAIGTLSGALGAAYSANGPPVLLHVAAQREWNADRRKAVLAIYFLAANLVTAGAHALSDLVTGEVLHWLAWGLPPLLAGTLAGIALYRRLGEHDYRRLTLVIILVAGLRLVGRAL